LEEIIMEVGKLNVQLRQETGKGISRRLRRGGLVPGVCYGHGLENPLSIAVNPKELKASLDPSKGQNSVIQLSVLDGDKVTKEVSVMLLEYQTDTVRRLVTHVDLIAIDGEKTVEVDVPFAVQGKCPGVALENGQLHLVRREIPVRAKPAAIPTGFVLDVSSLHVNEVLHVSDLTVPAGVEVMLEAGSGLVTCSAPSGDKNADEAEADAEAPKKEGDAKAEVKDAKKDAKKPEDGK